MEYTIEFTEDKANQVLQYLGMSDITKESLQNGRWMLRGKLYYTGRPNVEKVLIEWREDDGIDESIIHIVAKTATATCFGYTCQHIIALNPKTRKFVVLFNHTLQKVAEYIDKELTDAAYWPIGEAASFETALDLALNDRVIVF
jgi:hypothetical protein